MPSKLDNKGLTQADYQMHQRIDENLVLTSVEKRTLTKMMQDWRKGWSKIVEAAQRDFNKMRRMECADEFGYCTCCCTGQRYHYTEIDAGHFISAKKQATRFSPENVWPQSKVSNNHNLGDDAKIQYTMFMQDRIGREGVLKLMEESREKLSWRDRKEELLIRRIMWQRVIKTLGKRLSTWT